MTETTEGGVARDDNDPADLVRTEWACPRCGERRLDFLVWVDDEHVECASCKAVYAPG
jgi:hypothetical protein